jgi:hypothetical protein
MREIALERANLPVELAPLDGPIELPPRTLVVDMRTLSRMTSNHAGIDLVFFDPDIQLE